MVKSWFAHLVLYKDITSIEPSKIYAYVWSWWESAQSFRTRARLHTHVLKLYWVSSASTWGFCNVKQTSVLSTYCTSLSLLTNSEHSETSLNTSAILAGMDFTLTSLMLKNAFRLRSPHTLSSQQLPHALVSLYDLVNRYEQSVEGVFDAHKSPCEIHQWAKSHDW